MQAALDISNIRPIKVNLEVQKESVRKFVICILQYNVGTIPLNTRKERHYSATLYHMHSQCNKHLQAGGAETQG